MKKNEDKQITESFFIKTIRDLKGFMVENFASKSDLKGLKNDLEEFRVEVNERFATKEDLKRFATKEDLTQALKPYATKEDLKEFPTRDEVAKMGEHIIDTVLEEVDKTVQKSEKRIISALDPRIKVLEHAKN